MIKLIALPLILFSCKLYAQDRVESSAYNLMLKILLSHSVQEIAVKDIKSGTGAVFIDARERKEYEVSHIQNAQWAGYDDFRLNRLADIPKDKKLIVYCSVGYRSEKIAEKLKEAGYTNVYNLYGGIFEWKNQGKAVYNDNGKTEKVHAFDRKWGFWLSTGEKVYE